MDKYDDEWTPPIDPFVTINFDMAFNQVQRISYSGIVARNAQNEILVSKYVLQRNVGSPFTPEGYTCLQAVLLGLQDGYLSVHIEGDSKSVVCKCESKHQGRYEISAIIYSIQNLKKIFHNIIFTHVARSGNSLAHYLATNCLKSKETYQVREAPDSSIDHRRDGQSRELN